MIKRIQFICITIISFLFITPNAWASKWIFLDNTYEIHLLHYDSIERVNNSFKFWSARVFKKPIRTNSGEVIDVEIYDFEVDCASFEFKLFELIRYGNGREVDQHTYEKPHVRGPIGIADSRTLNFICSNNKFRPRITDVYEFSNVDEMIKVMRKVPHR